MSQSRGALVSLGRTARLVLGLLLSAGGIWLSLRASLGVAPWDVLHVGVSRHTGLSFGTVTIVVGVLAIVASALLRVRPGIGTLVNVVLIGTALDWLIASPWLDHLPSSPLALRVLALVVAIAALGLGAALYIGAGYGAGPRDSLMVGCHRLGMPLSWARAIIETSALGAGWLLGGPVGIGTVLVAVGTGPAVQIAFRLLQQEPRTPGQPHRA
jgi:uncharacterized membrane protein YczE